MKAPRFKAVKTKKGWRLNIPAALSPNAKRSRRFFQTREAAEGEAIKLKAQLAKHGKSARILPPAQADAADRAFRLLGADAAPETLLEAVREYVERHNRQLQSLPFEDAFKHFIDLDTRRRGAAYRQSMRQYHKRLTPLHGRLLCDITARDIRSAMEEFPPTVFNYGLRILGGLFNYGRKEDLCATNPVGKLERKVLPVREILIYTPAQVMALMRASDQQLIPFLAACMFAGLRASEARKMRWSDFDFSECFIRVPAQVSKTRQPRAIPMEVNLKQWLLPFRRPDAELIAPQGVNVLRAQLRVAHAAAGAPRIKHGPRHTYASYLPARDGSIDALMLNMGHDESVTTFQHYASKLATKRAAKAFWSIYPEESTSNIVVMTLA